MISACYYCKGSLDKDDDEWIICNECNVRYFSSLEGSLHIKWIVDIGTAKWALNIFPDKNITYLSGYFPDKEDFYDEILINQTVIVNKDNVINKIKTILTFQ